MYPECLLCEIVFLRIRMKKVLKGR